MDVFMQRSLDRLVSLRSAANESKDSGLLYQVLMVNGLQEDDVDKIDSFSVKGKQYKYAFEFKHNPYLKYYFDTVMYFIGLLDEGDDYSIFHKKMKCEWSNKADSKFLVEVYRTATSDKAGNSNHDDFKDALIEKLKKADNIIHDLKEEEETALLKKKTPLRFTVTVKDNMFKLLRAIMKLMASKFIDPFKQGHMGATDGYFYNDWNLLGQDGKVNGYTQLPSFLKKACYKKAINPHDARILKDAIVLYCLFITAEDINDLNLVIKNGYSSIIGESVDDDRLKAQSAAPSSTLFYLDVQLLDLKEVKEDPNLNSLAWNDTTIYDDPKSIGGSYLSDWNQPLDVISVREELIAKLERLIDIVRKGGAQFDRKEQVKKSLEDLKNHFAELPPPLTGA